MLAALLAAFAAFVTTSRADVTLPQVLNGLVSFYPLDYLTPGNPNTTPDVISRRDMTLYGMTSNNIIASTRPSSNSLSVVNCFNFTQSGGATVIYYNSTGQNPLDMSGDYFPFSNQRGATMCFWIKANSPGTDTRFFGEADTTGAYSNPLWLWGDHPSAPGHAHLLMRQQDASGPYGSTTLPDGTYQILGGNSIGYYYESAGTYTTNIVFDGTWHMFTITVDTNGNGYVYVDGVLDPGPGYWTDLYGNPSVLRPVPVTNYYYTTNEYPLVDPPASNPPPRGYVSWVMQYVKTASTTFGGFKRGTPSTGLVCQIDDIAFWNRVLSESEIMFVMTNGLAGPTNPPGCVRINSYTADFREIGSGDQVTLRWNVIGATNLTIGGVGDVTALGLIASTNVTLNADTSFTLTARGECGEFDVRTATVSVKILPGVSSDWHLIQRFDGLFSDTTQGISGNGWVSALSDYNGYRDRWNVLALNKGGGLNKVLTPKSGYAPNTNSPLGFETRGALAYARLEGLTIPPYQTNTLFFRFSLREPPAIDLGGGTVLNSDMDCSIGLSDRNFIAPLGKSYGSNVGPFITISRDSGGVYNGGSFDLIAMDYGGSSVTNTYSYMALVDPNGLQTNVNYYVWMDVENYSTHAQTYLDGTTNTVDEPVFSAWLMKQGDTNRTLLFSGFHGNRDYIGYNPLIDFPLPYLDKVFLSIGDESIVNAENRCYFVTNTTQGGMIAVDDFYLSRSGFNSTIPKLFDLSSIVRGATNVTITWDSLGSLYQTNTYTVQRKLLITDSWTTLTNGLPSGGDVTTFNDTTVGSGSSAYYRIVWP